MGKPGADDFNDVFEAHLAEVKQKKPAAEEAAEAAAAAAASAERERAAATKSSKHDAMDVDDGDRDRKKDRKREKDSSSRRHHGERDSRRERSHKEASFAAAADKPDYPPIAANGAGEEAGAPPADSAAPEDRKDKSRRERSPDRKRSRRHREDSREGASSRRNTRDAAPADDDGGRKRSRSREKRHSEREHRDRDRDRGGRDRDRERERERERERSRERSRRSSRRRSRSRSGSADSRGRPAQLSAEEREAAVKQAAIDELTRDQRTVFVNQITAKVREKDLKRFFESCGGPVKNVIMLRDKATNRHRGFAYVEMRDLDAVPLVLQFSNTVPDFQKFPIMVKASEAEKNYLAKEEKAAAAAAGPAAAVAAAPITTAPPAAHISNIHPNVVEQDLLQILESFGTVVSCVLHKDKEGASRGTADVLYSEREGAELCVERLNGLEIAGRNLIVRAAKPEAPAAPVYMPPQQPQYSAYTAPAYYAPPAAAAAPAASVTTPASAAAAAATAAALLQQYSGYPVGQQPAGGNIATSNWSLDNDSGSGGVAMDSSSRAALMARLAQSAGLGVGGGHYGPPAAAPAVNPAVAAAQQQAMAMAAQQQQQAAALIAQAQAAAAAAVAGAGAGTGAGSGAAQAKPPIGGSLSFCILIKNMYNAAEEEDEGWELDIKEDTEAECSKHGKVVHTFVDSTAPGGLVWVMFAQASAAAASAATLNGRFFAQRMITVDYIEPTAYIAKFPEVAAAALQCTM